MIMTETVVNKPEPDAFCLPCNLALFGHAQFVGHCKKIHHLNPDKYFGG